jgi:hypothetical protein
MSRTGNSDHERWDNSPSKNEAPKPERLPAYDYKREVRAERIRVTIWILALIGGAALAVMWYHGWRP